MYDYTLLHWRIVAEWMSRDAYDEVEKSHRQIAVNLICFHLHPLT